MAQGEADGSTLWMEVSKVKREKEMKTRRKRKKDEGKKERIKQEKRGRHSNMIYRFDRVRREESVQDRRACRQSVRRENKKRRAKETEILHIRAKQR